MKTELENHWHEMFLIVPTLAVTYGECTDPECDAQHWRITVGWLGWSIHIYW